MKTTDSMKMRQIQQVIHNSLILPETKLQQISAIVDNRADVLTAMQAARLFQVQRGAAIYQHINHDLSKVDRELISSGLLRYNLVKDYCEDKTTRHFLITAKGRTALAVRKAVQS